MTALQEAKEYNVFREYNDLEKMLSDKRYRGNKYKMARYLLLKYIKISVEEDPENGDYYDPKLINYIKTAGKLLYEDDRMHDMLVWSFIPKRYQREIDMLWDGIGEWKG